jgi:hypothetical protein
MTSESKVIGISPATPAAKTLWTKTLELAKSFGAEERWSLIGGLMVQLHAFERGAGSRPTRLAPSPRGGTGSIPTART